MKLKKHVYKLRKSPIESETINQVAPLDVFMVPKPKKDPEGNMYEMREQRRNATTRLGAGRLAPRFSVKKMMKNQELSKIEEEVLFDDSYSQVNRIGFHTPD